MIKVKQVIKNNVLQTTPTQLFNSYEEVVTWLNANLVNIFSYTGSAIATTSTTDKWIIDMYCLECDTTKDCLLYLIQNDQQVKDALCANQCLPAIPSNVTNLIITDSNGGTYDCGNPILNWVASSGATSYDIFEGATLLGNTASTTFTVVGASVGSHTYTVIAKNSSGSASGVSTTVNITACLTVPNPITNLTSTDANGGAYDCGAPILNWTASAGATSYDIMEGAILITNVAANTYTFAPIPSIGNHTYTVVAKNSAGSSTGVNITVNIIACLSAPGNVTGTINVYDSGTSTNYTCGLGFDVDFTDVSGATYYQLFEGATQIGSNSATSNFVVTGQTAGSHTYTIKACNGVGCSTGTNFSVTLVTCGPIPIFTQNLPSSVSVQSSSNTNSSIMFDIPSNTHLPITGGGTIYNPIGSGCFKAKLTLVVEGYNWSGGNSGMSAIFIEAIAIPGIQTETNAVELAGSFSGSVKRHQREHILPVANTNNSYNQTIITELEVNDYLDLGTSYVIYVSNYGSVPPDAILSLTLGVGSKFEIFSC